MTVLCKINICYTMYNAYNSFLIYKLQFWNVWTWTSYIALKACNALTAEPHTGGSLWWDPSLRCDPIDFTDN